MIIRYTFQEYLKEVRILYGWRNTPMAGFIRLCYNRGLTIQEAVIYLTHYFQY